jgi:hypothetical protein
VLANCEMRLFLDFHKMFKDFHKMFVLFRNGTD